MGNIFDWDRETREIIETCGIAEMVVGYADTQEEADRQIATFRDYEASQEQAH